MRTPPIRRILDVWADDAVAFARVLADQDPTWRTETFPLGGGQAVLCGRGMYVNLLVRAGLERPLDPDQLERLERRCRIVGVPPAVEATALTHPVTLDILAARGYEVGRRTSALARQLGDVAALPPPDPRFVVERADGELLAIWQEASALGWGHDTPEQRRVSDAFARAAAVVDGEHFVVVRSVTDRRPVATASLTIRDRIATLGGMSTLPAERGRGVQSALIVHRLRTAAAAGCDWATSTAAPGGTSERNLLRHGFEPAGTISTWMR